MPNEYGDPIYYAYFFTVQDMPPEQQIVQTAHVALKLGYNSALEWDYGEEQKLHEGQIKFFNPSETYFTVIGVRNDQALQAVMDICDKFGFKYEVFVEPDQNNRITSIALYPVHEDHRGVLHAFNQIGRAHV